MLPGDFSAGDVTVFASRVVVNGVSRPATSVDLDGGWRSDLPSQISPAGSNMIRGGTIEWATKEDVSQRPVTAFRDWGVWRPAKGDRIVVYAGDGTSEWPRFTGVVDETTGSVGAGMSSTIVADVDRLSETFSCEPLLEQMPPLPGTTTWRNAGLSPIFLVDAAMRAGGYYVTPPRLSYTALSIPLQTSLLPEVDTSAEILSASAHTGGGNYQQNYAAPWGYAAANFEAAYRPAFTFTPSEPLLISVMITAAHAGRGNVFVHYGASNYIRLLVSYTGAAIVQRLRGSTLVEVTRLTPAQMAGATRVEVLMKDGQIVIRNNTGAMEAGSVSGLLDQPMHRIEVSAEPEARLAGVMVSHPPAWQEWANLYFESTARVHSGAGGATTWGIINASPRFNPQAAQSALEELADATLSALWIDEEGVLHFAPSGAVRSSPSVQTITTADDVLALSWSDRLLATARRVTVAYRHAAYKRGAGIRQIELARGSRQSLQSGTVLEDVYHPGTDEDWYGVATSPQKLYPLPWSDYNSDDGTYVGVSYFEGNDVTDNVSSSLVDITMRKTGVSEYTIIHEAGTLPSGITAETVTHPEWIPLWERNRNNNLPVIQGWGKITWVERETTQQTSTHGPVLRIDLGAYAREWKAEGVRDYLCDLVENAIPQITGLNVTPDPRRQIGDTITIRSENFLGVTIRGKVTGIDETISGDGYTQSLNIEPLHVSTGALTWAEWEAAFPGTLTYTQWQDLRDATDTYDDFNTQPLKGAE